MLLTSVDLAAGMATMAILVRKEAAEVQVRTVELSAKRKPLFSPGYNGQQEGVCLPQASLEKTPGELLGCQALPQLETDRVACAGPMKMGYSLLFSKILALSLLKD